MKRKWFELIYDLERITNEFQDKWHDEMSLNGMVKSRPTGHWEDEIMGVKCTNCNTSFSTEIDYLWIDSETGKFKRPNYCPKCGVQMEEPKIVETVAEDLEFIQREWGEE